MSPRHDARSVNRFILLLDVGIVVLAFLALFESWRLQRDTATAPVSRVADPTADAAPVETDAEEAAL